MTDKQKSILNSALKLFADKGFDAVSTSLIAKEANVSEGLIFRHFANKQGLLDAIMDLGNVQLEEMLNEIKQIEAPESRIQAVLEAPFFIPEDTYPFWRLMYALKWREELGEKKQDDQLKGILVESFKQLNYLDPDAEADLVLAYVDGFATTILVKGHLIDKERLLKTVRTKYK